MTTAMQYQRAVDDDAELQLEIERIENDMRRVLTEMQEFPLTYRERGVRKQQVYDASDVIIEMGSLDTEEFDACLKLLLDGKTEDGEKRLKALQARAIEQLIGAAPIWEAAQYRDPDDADFFDYREAI